MRRNGKKWLAALMLVSLLSGCLLAGASAEKKLTWPSNVKVVSEHMFDGNISIETVVLPEGVERIESGAFANCSSLKEIYFPSTLDITYEELEDVFSGCINLQTGHAPWECSEIRSWLRDKNCIPEYRALVIGEKTFSSRTAARNKLDADHMEAMLNSVSGLTGVEDHFTVTKKIDLSKEEIRSNIEYTFRDTRPQDVSLFFIATHGVEDSGDLSISNSNDTLPIATLAEWLTTYVQGKVIVILESCYAGHAIYSPNIQENGIRGNSILMMNSVKTEAPVLIGEDQFAELAVQVFAEKDPGVLIRQGPGGSAGGLRKNSGELRVENKFYVLAACRHDESSFGYEGTGNLFTNWLLEGIGNKTNSPADTLPKDGALTLKELFRYVSAVGDKHKNMVYGDPEIYYQHVQCYPKDCNFVCFLLR